MKPEDNESNTYSKREKSLIQQIKDISKEVFLDELCYGIGGYCKEEDGTIRKATLEELYDAINNPNTIILENKKFTTEEIINNWNNILNND